MAGPVLGHRRAAAAAGDDVFHPDPQALPHTDWLRHDLTVIGAAEEVAAFRVAAAGAGGIPWRTPDLDQDEEDRVHALLHPPDGSPGLSLAGARAWPGRCATPSRRSSSARWPPPGKALPVHSTCTLSCWCPTAFSGSGRPIQ